MPATINKQRVFSQIFSILPKRMDDKGEANGKAGTRPVLEQFIYALCREGTSQDKADRAFRNLHENFFDWNEIRVSSVREVADALAELPQPESRAHRIIQFLQEVFETTFSFDLELLHKKGLKEAAKKLSRYGAANDYAVSWVVQQSLGGHAIPVDQATLRVVQRMGLIELEQTDIETIRGSLEHQVPKAKGSLFTDVVSNLAEEFCLEPEPICSRCPMSSACSKLLEIRTTSVDDNTVIAVSKAK